MKIAFICTNMLPVPSIRGGAIQILIDGVTPYISRKHELTIFSVSDPDLPEEEIRDGVHYIRLPREEYVSCVAKKLSRRSFDVIHVFNRPAAVRVYKTVAPNSRFVISLHNEMFAEKKIQYDLGQATIKMVNQIMTVSDYIGETINTRFPSAEKKVRTVYSGVDLRKYKPIWTDEAQRVREELRRSYGIENKKVILFTGRLSKVKGPDVLIQAMKRVIQTHEDAVLVIIGGKWFSDDSVNDYVRSLHELARPLGNAVKFTNYVPASQIPSHFLLGDVFVCSSQWQEPLARVHYEAMAAGLPVITTNRGGNGEIVKHGETGFLVDDYSNPRAFAAAINHVFSNPQTARRIAEQGRRLIESNFDFEHVAKRLEDVYVDAIGARVKKTKAGSLLSVYKMYESIEKAPSDQKSHDRKGNKPSSRKNESRGEIPAVEKTHHHKRNKPSSRKNESRRATPAVEKPHQRKRNKPLSRKRATPAVEKLHHRNRNNPPYGKRGWGKKKEGETAARGTKDNRYTNSDHLKQSKSTYSDSRERLDALQKRIEASLRAIRDMSKQ
ncbi:glycosyltransferase family 4 protein [Numidum massiliense]|uniref:glycosyltransferase family 4 protein n=1 Tax=Numidum massiliense TaxID=1522315 RepID=UPI00093A63D7|nr:glycosyltransferase family 4 protein [Numidum massiliense]